MREYDNELCRKISSYLGSLFGSSSLFIVKNEIRYKS